jgi:hypothetical protein
LNLRQGNGLAFVSMAQVMACPKRFIGAGRATIRDVTQAKNNGYRIEDFVGRFAGRSEEK